MAAATALADLRQRLANKAVTILAPGKQLPDAGGGADRIPTGSSVLDRTLAAGGVPRGRLTELHGPLGGGSTTLARAIAVQAVKGKRWVAYIDATRTLAPRDWAALGKSGRFWVIRPPAPDKAAWCADVLLRSGAFALVILDSAPPLSRAIAIRLTRLAQDRHAALLALSEGESSSRLLGAALRLRSERLKQRPSGFRPLASGLQLVRQPDVASAASLRITVEKGGAGGTPHVVEIAYATPLARRLCAHPEVPDRRGVAKRNRRGELVDAAVVRTGNAHGSSSAIAAHNATLPYKRRCAETPRDWLDDTPGRSLLGRETDRPDRVATRARGNGGRRTLADPRGHDGYGGQSALRRSRRATVG